MADFKVPLRDIRFSLQEVFNYTERCAELGGYEEVGDDLLGAILEEASKFVEQELAPINQSGDLSKKPTAHTLKQAGQVFRLIRISEVRVYHLRCRHYLVRWRAPPTGPGRCIPV